MRRNGNDGGWREKEEKKRRKGRREKEKDSGQQCGYGGRQGQCGTLPGVLSQTPVSWFLVKLQST